MVMIALVMKHLLVEKTSSTRSLVEASDERSTAVRIAGLWRKDARSQGQTPVAAGEVYLVIAFYSILFQQQRPAM